MDQRQFDEITRKMERRYGKLKKGMEDARAMLFFPMESNLLKVNRKHPESNSRRLKEAINLVLHKVNGYLTGEQDEGIKAYETEDNTRLRDALLMAFDPFTNEEIRDVLSDMNLNDAAALNDYYKEPVLCIMRIKDSVEHWEKRNGSNGYFLFLEDWLGEKVQRDDKMEFSILMSAETITNDGEKA